MVSERAFSGIQPFSYMKSAYQMNVETIGVSKEDPGCQHILFPSKCKYF